MYGELDINLINKIKKILFGSLNRSLLILNVIAVVITIFMTVAFIESTKGENPEELNNDANSAYIASRFVTRNDESCAYYLNEVADLYNFNMAVVDKNEKVLMKSINVTYEYIDRDYPFKELKGNYFGQIYDIRIDNEPCYLYVWRETAIKSTREYIWILVTIILLIIGIIYLLVYVKVKYIKKIANGVEVLSLGDLTYNIEEKGIDELNFLANKINNMSRNLKNMIDKEKEEERLKYELITNISHDLRTPLTSLIGYLQLIDKKNDEDIKKYTKVSLENANRLKKLIDDLFEYSKLESKDFKLNRSKVNVVEIIDQCLGELELESKSVNISFIKEFLEEEIILNIDPDKIARVFQNIFINSIKYSKEKTKVRIKIVQRDNKIEFLVTNQYKYLDKNKLDRIFDRFYRGDSSRSLKTEGSGLGLAIVKSIVTLHKGEVFIKHDEIKESLEIHVVLRN